MFILDFRNFMYLRNNVIAYYAKVSIKKKKKYVYIYVYNESKRDDAISVI